MSITPQVDITQRLKIARSVDTFSRANQSGFGTASGGESWSTATGSGTYSITSNRGQVTAVTALTLTQLGTGTGTDIEVLARMSGSSTNYTAIGVFLRGNGSNTCYRARFNTNNSAQGFGIVKTISGTTTNLVLATATISINTNYWIRFRAIGANLSAKYWADGSAEPSAWTLTINDSSLTGTGNWGIVTNTTTSGDTALFDTFSAADAQASLVVKDVTSRLKLKASTSKNLPLRMKLLAQSLKDMQLRMILHGLANRDIPLRMILSLPLTFRNMMVRVIIAVILQKNVPLRLNLLVTRARDMLLHANIARQTFRDDRLRLRLLAPGGNTIPLRVSIQVILPSLGIPAPPPGISSYQGLLSTVPIGVPIGNYLINNQALDIPALCSAPILQGGYLLAGSVFTLSFQNPSSATQTLLTSGTTATMALFLADGRSITSTVQIASSLSGGQLSATFTVLSTIAYSGYVTITQFF